MVKPAFGSIARQQLHLPGCASRPRKLPARSSQLDCHSTLPTATPGRGASQLRNCTVAARPLTSSQDFQEVPIENLDREYCEPADPPACWSAHCPELATAPTPAPNKCAHTPCHRQRLCVHHFSGGRAERTVAVTRPSAPQSLDSLAVLLGCPLFGASSGTLCAPQ